MISILKFLVLVIRKIRDMRISYRVYYKIHRITIQ